jgi:hypothetical protein
MVTVQVNLVPEQPPPDQPVKFDAEPAAAVNVSCVPAGSCAEQVLPQLIPPVSLVTVPEPEPVLETVRVGVGLVVVADASLEVSDVALP